MPGDSTALPGVEGASAREPTACVNGSATSDGTQQPSNSRLRVGLGSWLLSPDHERERSIGAANGVEAFFEPVALVALVAIFVAGFAGFGLSVAPAWDVQLLVPFAAFVAAAAVLYTRRLDRRDFKWKEWTAILAPPIIVLRFAPYVVGSGDLAADAGWWLSDAKSFFTASFIVNTLLLVFSWAAALSGARSLDLVRPQASEIARERSVRNYRFDDDNWVAIDHAEPMRRLSGLVLWGGVVLVTLAGLAAIGVQQILSIEAIVQILTLGRPAVSLALANVVVYFALALLLIAEGQSALQKTRWRLEHLEAPSGFALRWLIQTGIAVLAIVLIALALPTAYALTIAQMLEIVLGALMEMVQVIIGLFVLVLAVLTSPLRALFPTAEVTGSAPPPPPAPPVAATPPADPVPWLGLAQSLLFWVVVLGIVVYCLIVVGRRLRLSGHGAAELLLRPLTLLLRVVLAALAQLGRLGRRAAAAVAATVAAALPGRRTKSDVARRLRWVPLARLSPAEVVEHYYLSVIERAARAGLPRRTGETAAEFSQRLPRQLPEAEPDFSALTASFEEIRYGRRTVDKLVVAAVKARWQRLKLLLRSRRLAGQRPPIGD